MQDIAFQMGNQNEKTKIFIPGDNSKKGKTVEQETFNKDNWEEYQKEVKEYNNNLGKLDKEYTSFQPFHDVIIRMYHREEVQSDAGIIMETGDISVGQKAAGGTIDAIHSYVSSPWRYQTKGVVVAVPENIPLKPGEIVQIKSECIIPVKDTQSDFILPLSFTLAEHYAITPPKKVSDKHFGYLRVNFFKHVLGRVKS